MRPSCVLRVQNVSPSGFGLSFDGKTHMFRRVFFMFLLVFLGCLFGACRAYFADLVGSVELFVVFFVFNSKNIVCL